MHWLDIVLIVLLVIFGLVGFRRGFLKSILALFTFVVTLALVIWLAPKVVPIVDGWFSGAISNFFIEHMSGVVQNFGGSYINTELGADTTAGEIINSFEVSGIVTFLLKAIFGVETLVPAGTEVTPYFASGLGSFVTMLVGGIVLYILIQIVLSLLGKLFDRIGENRAISGIDKLLGFILGVVKCLIFISVALAICKLLSFIPFINDFITQLISGTEWLQKYANWLYELLDSYIESIDFNALLH